MVIGIDAVLVVIRGIRVTLMRLTMKKIIEHNPRKGIFFAFLFAIRGKFV